MHGGGEGGATTRIGGEPHRRHAETSRRSRDRPTQRTARTKRASSREERASEEGDVGKGKENGHHSSPPPRKRHWGRSQRGMAALNTPVHSMPTDLRRRTAARATTASMSAGSAGRARHRRVRASAPPRPLLPQTPWGCCTPVREAPRPTCAETAIQHAPTQTQTQTQTHAQTQAHAQAQAQAQAQTQTQHIRIPRTGAAQV